MRVAYRYKDKDFLDIRDIVFNNKLVPNFNHILFEYLPFQVFVTGDTFFKDVTIKPSVKFNPDVTMSSLNGHNVLDCLIAYIDEYKSSSYSNAFALALSGGVDSSFLAVTLEPEFLYTGFYKDGYYDEVKYAEEVSLAIEKPVHKIELTEQDFIDTFENYIQVVCTPIAGMGGVMEYSLLRKFKSIFPQIDNVLFGNGGDEIFMGYWFNHYVRDFFNSAFKDSLYLNNFRPSKIKLALEIIDWLIVASINRYYDDTLSPTNPVVKKLIKSLKEIDHFRDKLLSVNINMTLPSLLHVNQCICNTCKVVGLNPLANATFVEFAGWFNNPMSDVPKQFLREFSPKMPHSIKMNYTKHGFPIPVDKWARLSAYFKTLYTDFYRRELIYDDRPYDGINRRTWAIACIELWFRSFVDAS